MKIKATKLFIIILFFIGNSEMFSQNDSFTLLGRWAEGGTGTVVVKNNIAFIGNGSNLTLVDVSAAETPTEISSYLFTNIVSSIALSDHYAYVVGASLQLHIIDFSDPNNLIEVGSTEISSYNSQKIFFSNNFIYIQLMRQGVEIIDVSDPTLPVDVGILSAPSIEDVFISDNYAYIAAGLDGMFIYNVSDPANPTLESTIEVNSTARCAATENNYTYLCDGANLRIFDISDKTNPLEISSVESYFKYLVLDGGFIYGTEKHGSLSIINVSDPHNPTVTTSLPIGTFRGGISIAINGDNLFVADPYHGLRILDVSNQTNPAEISLFRTGHSISDVVVKDNFIYTSDIYNGLYILRHENKSDITCISKLVPESKINDYYCLELQGNYAYLGSEYGMYIIDISDPSNPFIFNEIPTPRISKIEVHGSYAYLLFWDGTFSILDISDLLNPVEITTLDDLVYLFSVQNDKIFIVFCDSATKLSVLDISDAYNPEVISDVDFDDLRMLRDISVNGNYVYAVGGRNLNIIDISNAENPSIAGTYAGDGPEDWRSISVSGEDAYICDSENLTTINISDPANPLEAEKYNTPNTPFGATGNLFVVGTTIYFAQYEVGLLILENNSPTDVDFDLLPSKFSLEQNYPNPFGKGTLTGSSTTITYSVPSDIANETKSAFSKEGQTRNALSNVTLKVYDILGREIATLVNKKQTPGNYSVQFSADNLSSGIYFYKLDANNVKITKKMIILK